MSKHQFPKNYDVGITEEMLKRIFYLKANPPSLYVASVKAVEEYFISHKILLSLGHTKISLGLKFSLYYSRRRIIVPV